MAMMSMARMTMTAMTRMPPRSRVLPSDGSPKERRSSHPSCRAQSPRAQLVRIYTLYAYQVTALFRSLIRVVNASTKGWFVRWMPFFVEERVTSTMNVSVIVEASVIPSCM